MAVTLPSGWDSQLQSPAMTFLATSIWARVTQNVTQSYFNMTNDAYASSNLPLPTSIVIDIQNSGYLITSGTDIFTGVSGNDNWITWVLTTG